VFLVLNAGGVNRMRAGNGTAVRNQIFQKLVDSHHHEVNGGGAISSVSDSCQDGITGKY
jgi:hypothetical protein